ncbi:aquaporin-5-like [Hydractinia symbiolongicarpus]|uniref:aquaporin-5-like n=1 Tax=Hydractinia symbiolongicarpus TaxID=13093 RepID=UPI00254AD59A|nr:aquaporin-5-like [Hydractinia symbiolongicarpus]XP_057290053.1 aquaporin-5-like [Hydractinia symbiolongicarpus]
MQLNKSLGFHEVKKLNFWRAVFAEFLVSVIYIIIACGCGLSLSGNAPSHLHIALTVAFTVAVLASAFWDVSGGHFNPVVTLALLIKGDVSLTRFCFYVFAQCLGSVAGCGLLYLYTPENFRGTLGALSVHKDISPGIACAVEITLTFQLIWTVMASTDPIKNFTGFQAPLAIGLSVGIGLLVGIPYTGAALNPIRAFGPAIVMNKRQDHWVYWLGPFVGSALATLSYEYVFKLTLEKIEEVDEKSETKRNNFAMQA